MVNKDITIRDEIKTHIKAGDLAKAMDLLIYRIDALESMLIDHGYEIGNLKTDIVKIDKKVKK